MSAFDSLSSIVLYSHQKGLVVRKECVQHVIFIKTRASANYLQGLALAFLQGTKDRLLGITIDTAAGQTGAGSVKSLSIWLSRTLKASDLAQIDWNAVEDAFIQLVHTDASLEIITNSDDVFK